MSVLGYDPEARFGDYGELISSRKYDPADGAIINGYSSLSYNDWNEILEVACDKICKYVSEYEDPMDLQKAVCCRCPLAAKLMEFED